MPGVYPSSPITNGDGKNIQAPSPICRLVFSVAKGQESRARNLLDSDYIRAHFAEHFGFLGSTREPTSEYPPTTVRDVIWRSTFRVRVGVAERSHRYYPISKGNVLLVGDAAHVHSPAGGQGMNLGMRDGVAAAKAIAAHHFSTATSSSNSITLNLENELAPFRAFDFDRQRETLKVVRMTMVLQWFWTTQSFIGRMIRIIFLFIVSFIPATGSRVALRLSGLNN